MAIYKAVIRVGDHYQTRLVEAPTEATAMKHIAREHVSIEQVRTAEQIKDTAALAATGIKVETATAE
jgi:hypothetical protein